VRLFTRLVDGDAICDFARNIAAYEIMRKTAGPFKIETTTSSTFVAVFLTYSSRYLRVAQKTRDEVRIASPKVNATTKESAEESNAS
jgi:hypothetical protein